MYNIQKGLFMGLDGISINQLRVSAENNSAELNNLNRINDHKVIDGLNEGQKIDPDKEKDKDNQAFDFENDEDSENVESNEEEFVPVIKYDLSDIYRRNRGYTRGTAIWTSKSGSYSDGGISWWQCVHLWTRWKYYGARIL